jgi:hypothetical protein
MKNNRKIISLILVFVFSFAMLSFGSTTNNIQKGKTYEFSDIKKVRLITEYGKDDVIDSFDTVKFGLYPQSDANGIEKEPIEWIVLDRHGNNALLLSKYILDCKCYENEYKETTWETCSLRKWLNEIFLNYAFTINEQINIVSTDLSNNDNVQYRVSGGNNTVDKIFCLSIQEVQRYFSLSNATSDNMKLATKGTEYAKVVDENYSLWVNNRPEWYKGNSSFWLRSPGKNHYTAADVYSYGHIDMDGHVTDNHYFGVRPAMWVSY